MLHEIAEKLRAAPSRPLVAFVGDLSRTWYTDHYMLMEVMGILRDANPEVVIVNGGQYPFDHLVDRMAVRMGMDVFTYNEEVESMQRLAAVYDRPMEMLDGLTALIVLPREKEPWRGLGETVPAAIKQGIPVTAVNREGKSYRWSKVPTPRKKPSK